MRPAWFVVLVLDSLRLVEIPVPVNPTETIHQGCLLAVSEVKMLEVRSRLERIRCPLLCAAGMAFCGAVGWTLGYSSGSAERSLVVLGTENNVMKLLLGADTANALLLTRIEAEGSAYRLCDAYGLLSIRGERPVVDTQLTRLTWLRTRLPPLPDLEDEFYQELKTCLSRYSDDAKRIEQQ